MLSFNGHEIQFGHFPNGEVNVTKNFLYNKNKNSVINKVTLKYEGDEDLFRLALVRSAIDFPCELHITYVPYSRMDREKDYIFSLKVFANYINSLNFDQVVIYEPHSDVTPALIDRVKVVEVVHKLIRRVYDRNNYQLYYPDAGAQKRYDFYSPYETLVGIKKRDFKTGKILSLQVVGERHPSITTAVIVDDLCSKGGTFVMAADALREMGFTTIFLVVGHCEHTIFQGKVFEVIDQVITSDSILNKEQETDKLHIQALGMI